VSQDTKGNFRKSSMTYDTIVRIKNFLNEKHRHIVTEIKAVRKKEEAVRKAIPMLRLPNPVDSMTSRLIHQVYIK